MLFVVEREVPSRHAPRGCRRLVGSATPDGLDWPSKLAPGAAFFLARSAVREGLDQLVEVLLALEHRLDVDALVLAVGADVEDVGGHAAVAEGGNADVAQEAAVGGAGGHGGDGRDVWPELGGQLVDGGGELLVDDGGVAAAVVGR